MLARVADLEGVSLEVVRRRMEETASAPYRGRPAGCLKLERIADIARAIGVAPSDQERIHLDFCQACGSYYMGLSKRMLSEKPYPVLGTPWLKSPWLPWLQRQWQLSRLGVGLGYVAYVLAGVWFWTNDKPFHLVAGIVLFMLFAATHPYPWDKDQW
jgi:hypothetical protein